ncbi:hypothetical protein EVAR_41946_1 [Eumeta japonica]|uniref:Uncharacterized protein n=1 Tax=Eumeta variegata TaxID=151549 RepID=A0A4C1XIV8_EUMVA|nr:hypothetical protein EVAR_41946_1 [Eumeta japonica]
MHYLVLRARQTDHRWRETQGIRRASLSFVRLATLARSDAGAGVPCVTAARAIDKPPARAAAAVHASITRAG